jgi:NitT/TauT family transport system ATP-binding protein
VLGSRVAIFSARPSIIKKIIDVDYKRPRVAEDENLSVYEKEILSALRHQGPKLE